MEIHQLDQHDIGSGLQSFDVRSHINAVPFMVLSLQKRRNQVHFLLAKYPDTFPL
ncbi:hypothetical protein thalar_01024 [Litoreibacter arenae DSM 19593]|uniref:Uncharacterized protein n=1 Tax=Litoreibacter arenae DSM 19593 TaxID=1123360 RepID=S9S3Q3_9RHOB|nr:hypothetical protein thalar_01024 [Litoreibacter arenae DSM 19593]